MQRFDTRTSQGLVLTLQGYWIRQGCTIVQPLGMEVGIGTSHPMTYLRALGPESMATVYTQSSRRPTDDRYGENLNCLQRYHQFQVATKPSPDNIQELYLGSLEELGMDPTIHDIRFVEDNWENLTPGAQGLGWEVWLNDMEVAQFACFQQVGGLECKPVTGGITYGLERPVMYIQGANSVYDLVWSGGPLGKTTYDNVFHQSEVEQSIYNLEYTGVDFLFFHFEQYKKEAQQLLALKTPLPLPTYERILKVAHSFSLSDVRKIISVTEHQHYVLCIRTLTKVVVEAYYVSHEALGFSIYSKNK